MRKVLGWLAIAIGISIVLIVAVDMIQLGRYLRAENHELTLGLITSDPQLWHRWALFLFVAAVILANGLLVIRIPRDQPPRSNSTDASRR